MSRSFIISFLLFASLLAKKTTLPLGDLGSVCYYCNDDHLLLIKRVSPAGETLYSHSYQYDCDGKLLSEKLIGDLGEVYYESDQLIATPFGTEICEYDEQHNLINRTQDGISQYYEYNEENALLPNIESDTFVIDRRGNVVQIGNHSYFEYDINERLVESQVNGLKAVYTYDMSGKRIAKTFNSEIEKYIYFEENEIAILDGEDRVKQLRIPGLPFRKGVLRPIAIETENAIYAPIHDIQGNIVKLIDIASREVILLDKPDPFGVGLSNDSPSPWIFSGKHYDSNTGLVYFGARFYSPKIRKWLTKDPLFESIDLYQYCFNNPFYFFDPDGRSSEEAKEHYDRSKKALLEGIGHAAVAGATIEIPPIAIIEAYQATTSFLESAKEYNKGYDMEEEENEKEEQKKKKDKND